MLFIGLWLGEFFLGFRFFFWIRGVVFRGREGFCRRNEFVVFLLVVRVVGWVGSGVSEFLFIVFFFILRLGTEFEYIDSESEVKVRKRLFVGLLRFKKGSGESGFFLVAFAFGIRGFGFISFDKVKLVVEKGRKVRKLRGFKEFGFEVGFEVSDDDLWTRRRSERIFLYDVAVSAFSSVAFVVIKFSRCGKGGSLSSRKDVGRVKDRKDFRKVGFGL